MVDYLKQKEEHERRVEEVVNRHKQNVKKFGLEGEPEYAADVVPNDPRRVVWREELALRDKGNSIVEKITDFIKELKDREFSAREKVRKLLKDKQQDAYMRCEQVKEKLVESGFDPDWQMAMKRSQEDLEVLSYFLSSSEKDDGVLTNFIKEELVRRLNYLKEHMRYAGTISVSDVQTAIYYKKLLNGLEQ